MTVSARLSTPATAIPADLFRSAFRQHAAGVAVITAHGARPVGFTATSLTSVSAEPPLVSFGAGTRSSSWPVLADASHVGVHILGESQQGLAETFARSGADRFAQAAWSTGPHGVPVLDGVLAWLVCRVVARIPAGDHQLVIGEAVDARADEAPGRPLLYHQGAFHGLRH